MSIGGRHIGSNQRINEPALLSIWSSDEMAWALACVAYWVQRWLSRNTSRSQVGQRCSIRTPPPAYPIFWTSIPLAANGVHVFAASFIYMNGDKPRSEYYHLRSICCYTTDFELNLQNEKNKYKPTVFAFITRALCRRKVRKDETDLFPVKSRRFTWKQKTKIQRTMRLHHRTIWPWCCSCSKDMGCQIRNQLFNIRGFRVISGLSFFHGGHG